MLSNIAGRLIGAMWVSAALAACTTAPSAQLSPLPPEFGLVKELSPEFESSAEGWFTETVVMKDGRKFEVQNQGLVYKCAGRPQEYFEFLENPDGGPPDIVSRDKPDHLKQFDAATFPEEMLKAFSDRTAASDEDAIRNLLRLEPGSWPPFGLADYIAFEEGWLIAYDIGEFGGALIWLPKRGDSYIISDRNTHDLLRVGDVIYAAQGLDHLSMTEGVIDVVRKGQRIRPRQDKSGEQQLILSLGWKDGRESYPVGSSVLKIALRNGALVGLTHFGLVYVGTDGVVRYNHPKFYDRRKVVQQPGALYIDQSGRVYVGGADMIGVYSGLPDNLIPELYARRNCDLTFRGRREERR